jgi:Cu(I)/Ag(I) efflux system membrane fusion protein
MKNINILKYVGVLLGGLLLGWLFFGGTSETVKETEQNHNHSSEKATKWTCSMHPQIQRDEAGKCPLCGMDLIPMGDDMSQEDDEITVDQNEIQMTASAMKLAEIQTVVVKKEKPEKEIRLLGKVKPDERLIYSQTAHIAGRIEKLYINFTGEKVRKGQKLASIYSPELVMAQKELFEILKGGDTNSPLAKAARNKLKLWKLTDEQIQKLEQNGEVKTELDILSDYDGYVWDLKISEGNHVMEGKKLFEIVNLNKVWVLFEAYENDLAWVKVGDKIEIEFKAISGKIFKQKITFIDPFIDPKTRVSYLRAELPNYKKLLKPDMFANGIIQSKLPISKPVLVVPKSSVLWMGKKAVVYVKVPERKHTNFLYREVVLGEDVGNFYVIKSGLEEGEEIATNGVFKIDAAAQLSGKKSMMNPTGGKVSTGHNHGGTKNDSKDKKSVNKIDKSKVSSKFKKQLGIFVSNYLSIKDALANDDASKAQNSAINAQKSLKKVAMKSLKGDEHTTWMQASKHIAMKLKSLAKTNELKAQRVEFLELSSSLLGIVQVLGVEMPNDKKLYSEFCPMADNNKGGYWLSSEKEIKNPFFGQQMLTCGSVKEEF